MKIIMYPVIASGECMRSIGELGVLVCVDDGGSDGGCVVLVGDEVFGLVFGLWVGEGFAWFCRLWCLFLGRSG